MRTRLIALLAMTTLVSAQTPHAFLLSAVPTNAAGQITAPVAAPNLTVPAGTAIPLTLINPIKKKSTKPGDAVRATVAFPIMSGMQVAIPAGSYVEGVVQTATARTSDTNQPAVAIHFTRLVFANGYSLNLDANSTQAEEVTPNLGQPVGELASLTPAAGSLGLFAQTTQPTLPPLPGPPVGVIVGAMVGGTVGILALLFIAAHHSQSRMDYVLFDAGWQFQMVLQSPLAIDASRATAASTTPSAN